MQAATHIIMKDATDNILLTMPRRAKSESGIRYGMLSPRWGTISHCISVIDSTILTKRSEAAILAVTTIDAKPHVNITKFLSDLNHEKNRCARRAIMAIPNRELIVSTATTSTGEIL